jgi:hypothetical protein
MTTAQLSDRMTKLAERHDVLKASVAEFSTVNADLKATSDEFQKRFGIVAPAAPAKSKGSSAPRAPRAKKEGDSKYPSLKEVVQTILSKNADGLELKGIVAEVQGMINRKEYASGAKSLSAVVSQAVNALKQESLIKHDRDTKKYSNVAAA